MYKLFTFLTILAIFTAFECEAARAPLVGVYSYPVYRPNVPKWKTVSLYKQL